MLFSSFINDQQVVTANSKLFYINFIKKITDDFDYLLNIYFDLLALWLLNTSEQYIVKIQVLGTSQDDQQ